MLLGDSRTEVNKGKYTPLYSALINIAIDHDYFYQVAKLLLNHNDIDVNVETNDHSSTLGDLCKDKNQSALGVEFLLEDPKLHIYKGSPAFKAARYRRMNILEMILIQVIITQREVGLDAVMKLESL